MRLIGKKIFLKPISKEDILVIHEWRNNEITRMNLMMHPYLISDESDMEWYLQNVNNRGNKSFYFSIFSNDDEKILGYTSLTKINWVNRTSYFGILIGEEKARGKGYGKETTELIINYAFDKLNLRKIQLDVLVENTIAIHTYNNLGFNKEGIFTEHFYWDGNYLDVMTMAKFNLHGSK